MSENINFGGKVLTISFFILQITKLIFEQKMYLHKVADEIRSAYHKCLIFCVCFKELLLSINLTRSALNILAGTMKYYDGKVRTLQKMWSIMKKFKGFQSLRNLQLQNLRPYGFQLLLLNPPLGQHFLSAVRTRYYKVHTQHYLCTYCTTQYRVKYFWVNVLSALWCKYLNISPVY